ncbi:hypothetical protein ACJJTC_004645, partial [Scirpophaga incertulas]
ASSNIIRNMCVLIEMFQLLQRTCSAARLQTSNGNYGFYRVWSCARTRQEGGHFGTSCANASTRSWRRSVRSAATTWSTPSTDPSLPIKIGRKCCATGSSRFLIYGPVHEGPEAGIPLWFIIHSQNGNKWILYISIKTSKYQVIKKMCEISTIFLLDFLFSFVDFIFDVNSKGFY